MRLRAIGLSIASILALGVSAARAAEAAAPAQPVAAAPLPEVLPPKGPVTPPPPGSPSLEQILAKARSLRGPEDRLDALRTLRFEGEVFDGEGNRIGGLVQLMKKPAAQRAESTRDGRTNLSATDGEEAWLLTVSADGRRNLSFIAPPLLEKFIDSGFEVLYPYRGPQLRRGGTIVLEGQADFLGVPCWKATFRYPQGLVVNAYFEQATGGLRGRLIENESLVYLEGSPMTVDGLTFPSELLTYKDGKLQNRTKFSRIIVNPPLEDKIFAVPPISALLPAPPPADPPASGGGSPPPPSLPVDPTLKVPSLAPLPSEQPQLFTAPAAQ